MIGLERQVIQLSAACKRPTEGSNHWGHAVDTMTAGWKNSSPGRNKNTLPTFPQENKGQYLKNQNHTLKANQRKVN
eukprot:3973868-Prorocentrum_lima.AAC.1